MKFLKNKKSAVQAIQLVYLALVIVGGFFVGKELGLFAVLYPTTTNANTLGVVDVGALGPYYNTLFYGDAALPSSWTCDKASTILVRSNFQMLSTSIPSGSGLYFGYTTIPGQNLNIYSLGSSNTGASYCGGTSTSLQVIYTLPNGLRVVTANGALKLCTADGSSARALINICTSGCQLSISPQKQSSDTDPQRYVETLSDIRDAGKWACSADGLSVVRQFCGSYGTKSAVNYLNEIGATTDASKVVATCKADQRCQAKQLTNDWRGISQGTVVVKCGAIGVDDGMYQTGVSVCSSDNSNGISEKAFTTTSTGLLSVTSCTDNYGFECKSYNNVATCFKCDYNWVRCGADGNKHECNGATGQYKTEVVENCGAGACVDNLAAHTATCTHEFAQGYRKCVGNGPGAVIQEYDTAKGFQDAKDSSGATLSCLYGCSNGVCTNQEGCTKNGDTKCGYELGQAALLVCEASEKGNSWKPANGVLDNSKCTMGSCSQSDTQKCAPICTDGSICMASITKPNLQSPWTCTQTPNANKQNGEYIRVEGTPCMNTCEGGVCKQLDVCVGKSDNSYVCKDTYTSATCQNNGQTLSLVDNVVNNCQKKSSDSSILPGYVCSSSTGRCVSPSSTDPFYCDGSSDCDGSVVMKCEMNVKSSRLYATDCHGLQTAPSTFGAGQCQDDVAGTNNAQCVDLCPLSMKGQSYCSPDYGKTLSTTSSGDVYKCLQDSAVGGQLYSTLEDSCDSLGCSNGKCVSECNGYSDCRYEGKAVNTCTDQGTYGQTTVYCKTDTSVITPATNLCKEDANSRAYCNNICAAKGDTKCIAGYQYTCDFASDVPGVTPSGQLYWKDKQQCSLGCEVEGDGGVCKTACVGNNNLCDAGKIKKCSAGVIVETLYTCQDNKCYTDANNVGKCTDLCTLGDNKCILGGEVSAAGILSLSKATMDSSAGDSYSCVEDTAKGNQKYWKLNQPVCGDVTCDTSNGLCVAPCTGSSDCDTLGRIFACDSNSRFTNTLLKQCVGGKSYCDGSNTDAICKNLCTADTLDCGSDENQYKCKLNADTNQYTLQLDVVCDKEQGCNDATSKCYTTAAPNTYYCGGLSLNTIYKTDSNGIPIKDNSGANEVFGTCGLSPNSLGLTSSCISGKGYCSYCTKGKAYCNGKDAFTCGNESEGTAASTTTCEVGCYTSGTGVVCNNLNINIATKQTFAKDKNIEIAGYLTGSSDGAGINNEPVKVELTLPDRETPLVATPTTNSDGKFITGTSFPSQPIGNYTATVTFPNYPGKKVIVDVKVSDSYVITLKSAPTVTLVPRALNGITVQSVAGTSSYPDRIKVNSITPSGIIVTPTVKSAGLWFLQVTGEPGRYTLELSSEKGTTQTESITQEIQVFQPNITVSSNIPEKTTKGSKQYNLFIKGPTAAGVSQLINPDSVSATVNGEVVDLVANGDGNKILKYNFETDGEYTISAEATLADYATGVYTKSVQVGTSSTTPSTSSSSGSGTPSTTMVCCWVSSGNSSQAVWASACSGSIVDPKMCGTTTTNPPGSSNTIWIIVIAGIVVYFLTQTNKRRRR